ncbi:hypothetical protein LUZ61_005023 [Rhynchospora tenuis]|uniref:F-box domain-containing protein n=1 Tax=Rhynchospora tenuis TaxID=198213 RepID=A0AAD5ZNX0_9POAL|nr:hypothetical protein LUZ61_005023 [Rhynchospora tenuis]
MESLKYREQPTWESGTNAVTEPQMLSSQGIHLPIEITSDILSRLPVPTVLRFRSVCKAWSHLTCTNAFVHQHMKNFGKNETDHGSIHISRDFYEYALEYCSKGHSRSVKFNDKTTECYQTSNCCNGLVCVYNNDIDNSTILIINPAIDSNFVKLPDVGITKREVRNVYLCHDDRGNKYKVVRFFRSSDDEGLGIEVLTLGDTTWRQVVEIPTRFLGIPQYASGAMHWMVCKDKIFFFKSTDETFGFIECPLGDTSGDDEDIILRKGCNLTVYEGSLCIVRRHWHPWKLKYFVMEDYVNRVWIEHVIDLMQMDETPFSHEDGFDRCPQYISIEVQNGKFLLEDEPRFMLRFHKDKYYYYNPKTESFEKYDGKPQRGHQYKESFVSAQRICNEES